MAFVVNLSECGICPLMPTSHILWNWFGNFSAIHNFAVDFTEHSPGIYWVKLPKGVSPFLCVYLTPINSLYMVVSIYACTFFPDGLQAPPATEVVSSLLFACLFIWQRSWTSSRLHLLQVLQLWIPFYEATLWKHSCSPFRI